MKTFILAFFGIIIFSSFNTKVTYSTTNYKASYDTIKVTMRPFNDQGAVYPNNAYFDKFQFNANDASWPAGWGHVLLFNVSDAKPNTAFSFGLALFIDPSSYGAGGKGKEGFALEFAIVANNVEVGKFNASRNGTINYNFDSDPNMNLKVDSNGNIRIWLICTQCRVWPNELVNAIVSNQSKIGWSYVK